MSPGVVVLVAAVIFGWGVLSARLERADLTAPIVFVGLGVVIANVASIDTHIETETIKLLTEVTLVWVLFSDATRVGVRELRAEAGVYLRLLGIALPLTVALGWLLAWQLFSGFDVWLALLVGSALAPTDAALGMAVVTNPSVPARIRKILNVESGLNDGLVTPVVMIALAGAAAAEDHHGSTPHALVQLIVGAGVGIAIGLIGGRMIRLARRKGWVDEEFAGPAVLALALVTYEASLLCGGNGFVAAFVGGITFGQVAGRSDPKQVFYVEQTAGLASLLVWTMFGLVAVPLVVDGGGVWRLLLYSLLSLTLIRMLPVVLLLRGSGLSRRAAVFIAWFGPRGLASVVFALLAVEQLGGRADTAVAVIVTTVLLSVLAHGITAGPLAARYAARSGRAPVDPPEEGVLDQPVIRPG